MSLALPFALLLGFVSLPAEASGMQTLDLTRHWVGYLSVVIFFIAYLLVAMEEKIHLRKSKPVMLAAGLIWVAIAVIYSQHNIDHTVHEAIEETFIEYARLFFFLLVAMTYISALLERGVFEALRNWLVTQGFGYKSLFWITGALAFIISPVADNLTTALIMCAVVLVVGAGNDKFIAIACINIVVAANAGGAFSPFGDITTLMVWQKGVVEFREFFALFIPSLVNFLLPAAIMYLAVPEGRPTSAGLMQNPLKVGGIAILILFFLTIATAVSFHNFLHIPPVFGMMLGLAYLKLFGFYLLRKSPTWSTEVENPPASEDDPYDFDVFARIAQAEWDTLFFFYGVIMAVGGLGFIGYLELLSSYMYGELGALNANILVGILSAFVDNIPVMFAVLTMQPDMPHVQWLLVTLTAGVGGSLLSIGSAAGVALMGQARGKYTFFTHLRWTPVIALGYFASIYVHLLING